LHLLANLLKTILTFAGMLVAAAATAFAITAALSRAEQPARDDRAAVGARGERVAPRSSPEVERAKPGKRPSQSRRRHSAGRRITWRKSVAVGLPYAGHLVRGVQLPAAGRTFFSWDPIKKRKPNRGWRRWGTDELVRTVLAIARDFARENPGAPRIAVGDLSRPQGGDFGPQWGSIGHASHQNGLDVDVYYPLRNGKERAPRNVSEVDMRLAQDLVDRFVRAGAEKVFVGPSTPLVGPPGIVQPLVHHDNHLHVRLPG
jgi:murein endopeptidase